MLSLALYLYFPMLLFDVLPYLCIYTFDWIVFFLPPKQSARSRSTRRVNHVFSRFVLHHSSSPQALPGDFMQPASSRSQSRTSRTHERTNAAPSSSPPPRASTSSSSRASAPPSKRARLGSRAPSRAGSVSVDPLNELHSLRKDSSQRLLDSWNQLAERYARPLDQDDIIDLRTKSIVLDAGALRGTADTYDFGALTKQAETEAAEDEGEGDDFDELDLLGQEPDISGGLQGKLPNIPPVRVMDPSDAADLREFMELEQRRREQFGDVDGDDIVFTRPKLSSSGTGVNGSSTLITGASSSKPKPPRIPPSAPVEPPPDDDDSVDEFSAWEPNDATYVYLDNDGESNFEDTSTGLLSDDQLLPPPSSSPPPDFPPFDIPSSPLPSSRPSSSAPSPPRASHSRTRTSRLVVDSDRESSPEIEIIPVRSSPVKKLASSATFTSRAAVSLSSTKLANRPAPSKSHVLQLQTPPRSTSLTSLGTSSPFSEPPRAGRPSVRPQRPISDGSGSESEELDILTARARRPVSQAPALKRKTPVQKPPVDTSMHSPVQVRCMSILSAFQVSPVSQSPEHLVGRNKPRRRRDQASDAHDERTPDWDLSSARSSSPLEHRRTRRDPTLNKSVSQIRSAPAKESTPAASQPVSMPHRNKGKAVARSYPSPDRRSRSDTDSPPPQRVAPRRMTGRRPASPSTSSWDESEIPLSRERERAQRHPVARKRKRVSSDEGSPVLRKESHAPRRRPSLDRNDRVTLGNGRERLHRGDRRGGGHASGKSYPPLTMCLLLLICHRGLF
jgi:hypothetical protein